MERPERDRPRAVSRAARLRDRARAGYSTGAEPITGRWRAALASALAKEADAGRLAPWLAVGFGAGVLFYFLAPQEPSWIASAVALGIAVSLAIVARERPVAFALLLALAAMLCGFTVASVRGAWVAHVPLAVPTATVTLTGFVEARDASERSDRIVLRVTKTDPKAKQKLPARVRIAFRRGTAPAVGEHVEVRARLIPLIGPVRPGGYDFALGPYFSGLGATGFAIGKHKAVPAAGELPLSIRFKAAVERMRRGLAERIRLTLPGDSGAVAVALVTGIREAISADVNEALRISGLYHIISISGLHMALVAGALFALARGSLALVPMLALRRPIKKWAAAAALGGVTFYLVLSGAEVATQRSYVMIAIVLIGVMLDRPALTVRTLAAAVVATLIVSPEAVLNPGFQMSFAATLALVSFYERWAPVMAQPPAPGASGLRTFVSRSGRWIALGAATSFVAGLATAIYAPYHFHRLAPYGVPANVLTMPATSLLVMPGALLGVALMPFGFDALGWHAMGIGIDWLIAVAKKIAALPGADGRIAAFGAGAVLLATAALLVLAIPAARLRLAGIPLGAAALLLMFNPVRYDVLIDAQADVVAVRGADGLLAFHSLRRDRLAVANWLAADGVVPSDAAQAKTFACDEQGCTAKLADGALVAVMLKSEALLEDCRRAVLIVSRGEVPAACAVPAIDRTMLQTTGALGLRKTANGWQAIPARSPHTNRPWFGRRAAPDAEALARLTPKPVPPAKTLTVPDALSVPEVPDETSGEPVELQ